jgi:hypothetical protein
MVILLKRLTKALRLGAAVGLGAAVYFALAGRAWFNQLRTTAESSSADRTEG